MFSKLMFSATVLVALAACGPNPNTQPPSVQPGLSPLERDQRNNGSPVPRDSIGDDTDEDRERGLSPKTPQVGPGWGTGPQSR
jgi:hypothetical protein